MWKKKMMIVFVIVGQIACIPTAKAGLINYERRERIRKQREARELRTFKGMVLEIDHAGLQISVKDSAGDEKKQLKVQDASVLAGIRRYQKVRVRYHPRTKEVHALKALAEE